MVGAPGKVAPSAELPPRPASAPPVVACAAICAEPLASATTSIRDVIWTWSQRMETRPRNRQDHRPDLRAANRSAEFTGVPGAGRRAVYDTVRSTQNAPGRLVCSTDIVPIARSQCPERERRQHRQATDRQKRVVQRGRHGRLIGLRHVAEIPAGDQRAARQAEAQRQLLAACWRSRWPCSIRRARCPHRPSH